VTESGPHTTREATAATAATGEWQSRAVRKPYRTESQVQGLCLMANHFQLVPGDTRSQPRGGDQAVAAT
jgi:hypothetical protein